MQLRCIDSAFLYHPWLERPPTVQVLLTWQEQAQAQGLVKQSTALQEQLCRRVLTQSEHEFPDPQLLRLCVEFHQRGLAPGQLALEPVAPVSTPV